MKEKTVSISRGLEKIILDWAEVNCSFPEESLEKLRGKLVEKNYLAAAGSLVPRKDYTWLGHGYRDDSGPYFYLRWTIDSKGPPKARALIYRFIKREKLDKREFQPPLPSTILEIPNMCFYQQFRYDYYYCLKEELSDLRKKAYDDAFSKVEAAVAPYDRSREVNLGEYKPA